MSFPFPGSPIINISPPDSMFSQAMNQHWYKIITPSLPFVFGSLFCVIISMSLTNDQTHVSTIIVLMLYRTLSLHWKSHVLPVQPLTSATTDLSTASIVSPFLECHIIRITQCRAFSEWLISLNNVTFFLHVSLNVKWEF